MNGLLPTAGRPSAAGVWTVQRPEPARFWVRYRPRRWPAAEQPWSDLGTAVLRDAGAAIGGADADALPADLEVAPAGTAADTVYLPPVPAALEGERRAAAARIAAAGTPVLLQVLLTGGPVPDAVSDGPVSDGPVSDGPVSDGPVSDGSSGRVVAVYDPLPLLLAAGWRRALAALAEAVRSAPGAAAVWPLVPGLSDAEPAAAGAVLAAAGQPAAIQPLALELTPSQRRALAADRDQAVYDALFHRPPPAERPYARAVCASGAEPFLRRPLPDGPVAGNRRTAAALALAAELWVRVGRSPAAGQALFRAARWVDASDRDLEALAREGNLGVLPALDERARRVVEEVAERGAETASGGRYPALVDELLAEYCGPDDTRR